MKNVVIIPILVNDEGGLELPLGKLGESTLLETVYAQAKRANADNVIVTSHSKELARFCSNKRINFFPSDKDCPTGTHRCAEVAGKFRPEAKIGNVICWPLSYPFVSFSDVNEMMANYYKEGVSTLIGNVPSNLRKKFNQDESYVKMRSVGEHLSDFSRCPLPLAVCHIGIYMYSLDMLLKIGNILPTKLSIEERLEQLSWTQYGFKNLPSITRAYGLGLPIAIRTVEQLQAQDLILQGQPI